MKPEDKVLLLENFRNMGEFDCFTATAKITELCKIKRVTDWHDVSAYLDGLSRKGILTQVGISKRGAALYKLDIIK